MSNFHRLKNERLRDIAFIGVAGGIGAPDPGCGDGPGVFEAMGIAEKLTSANRSAAWKTTITPLEGSDKTSVVANGASRTASVVYATLMAGEFPIVLGGDHSCAIGSWRGVAETLGGKPLGLIWIDAHLDSHTPETSHSGALHGMPLACLLGVGPEQLTNSTQVLQPQHVAVIGVRSFEPEEHALIMGLGVRVFFMDEITRRGLNDVMQEALTIVQSGTAGFGISLDLD
ncbi:MAG: arginase family protein, partial [Pseudomonadota bacterium]|nr:arginase family protein [Pseudomonadota bacterium]